MPQGLPHFLLSRMLTPPFNTHPQKSTAGRPSFSRESRGGDVYRRCPFAIDLSRETRLNYFEEIVPTRPCRVPNSLLKTINSCKGGGGEGKEAKETDLGGENSGERTRGLNHRDTRLDIGDKKKEEEGGPGGRKEAALFLSFCT